MITRLGAACAVLCGVLFTTSCSSLSVNAIPLPGNDHRDGYDITVEFSNVLNLPDRANVVMDGTKIGVVSATAISGDHVDVTARIDPNVQIPVDANAVLEQATVLGDIYLALQRAPGSDPSGPNLKAGERILVDRTTSPPQLEDTIASLANFVGSGSIQRAQNTIIRINGVTPARPEARTIVTRITSDLRALSNNVDTVDQLLSSFNQTSAVFAEHAEQLGVWFSPVGVGGFRRDMVLANTFGRVLPSVGSVYNGGYWLVPLISSLADAFGAVQGTKQAVEAEYPRYRQFMNDFFTPQDKYPAINITSIVGPDGRELSGNVEQVMRMLGAMP